MRFMRWAVFICGLMVLGVAIFEPGLRFSNRCNLVTASVYDFMAVGFSIVWLKLMKWRDR
jgi:hypothetical protein